MQRLIFDLDGTISDPTVGIGRSINYALGAFGYPEIGEEDVSQHIGNPLDATFRRIAPGASAATILGMVAKYRAVPDQFLESPRELKGLAAAG
jgi:phosphoglycolate phosphatase